MCDVYKMCHTQWPSTVLGGPPELHTSAPGSVQSPSGEAAEYNVHKLIDRNGQKHDILHLFSLNGVV